MAERSKIKKKYDNEMEIVEEKKSAEGAKV